MSLRRMRLLVVGVLVSLAMAPAASAASSVNTSTGAYKYERVDAVAQVDGTQVLFGRTYDSSNTRFTSMGQGWTHNFAVHLEHASGGSGDMLLIGPGGRADRYTWVAESLAFIPRTDMAGPQPLQLTLITPGSGYVGTIEDGTIYWFDPTGRLSQIDEPGKPRLTLDQGPYGPSRVLGPEGQTVLQFGYDAATGRLLSVTDVPDSSLAPVLQRVVQYGYDQQQRLVSVSDRANQVTNFSYFGDGLLLQSIVDANNHAALTLTYDDQGRVVTRLDARGIHTQQARVLQYETRPDGTQVTVETLVPSGLDPSFAPTVTSVYTNGSISSLTTRPGPGDNPLVETWTWTPDRSRPLSSGRSGGGTPAINGVPAPIRTGPPGSAAVRVGDPDDPLPAPMCVPSPPIGNTPRDTVPWSKGTEHVDPRLDVARILGAAASTATGQLYDGFHRLTGFRDVNSGEWAIEYDAEDRAVRVVGPPGDVATIQYDVVGNVVSIQQPSGASTFTYDERDSLTQAQWSNGTRASYEYDERGDLSRARVDPTDGGAPGVADYAFDGLRRLRRVTRYVAWPNTAPVERAELQYDATGGCSAFSD